MPNEIKPIVNEIIVDKIYVIRDQKVMLDRDLSQLYNVETKRLNEQVKRNLSRFPEDFMFQLTEEEFQNLRSQIATSSWGGNRKLPYAFTEHGVLMLSSVLNSESAIQTNIQIMRIFSKIKQHFSDVSDIRTDFEKIKNKLENQGKNIELVFQYLDELSEKKNQTERTKIGYKK